MGPIGSRVTLSIQYDGLLGGLIAWPTRDLNALYLAMEINGLKAQCSDLDRQSY